MAVRSQSCGILVTLMLLLAGCGGSSSSVQPMPGTDGPADSSPALGMDSAVVESRTELAETAAGTADSPPPLSEPPAAAAPPPAAFREGIAVALRKAATFYREQVASHGGYVYYYSPDLSRRWGEGEATKDQVWVQPPGTPTVGMAYLQAYAATGDKYYLDAATDAAEALVYGQLASGGWTNCIDFDPRGRRSAQYRNGKGKGKNYSSLDDGQTQSAIRLLIHVDEALGFKHDKIHEAAQFALDALMNAQFPNGAFPQVWKGPVVAQPVVRATYPEYDWKTEGRIKEYWNVYTLNDNVPGYVAETLIDAHRIYGDDKYLAALRRLGDFLLLAQMPDPQPAWAQQYNYGMKPIWARKFEPPAISGDESQEVIETLMKIYRETGDNKYLEPIPDALAYLKRSLLPDGRLARYYELETNKPLYMSRRGDNYKLTYDDSKLPGHYGWKVASRLDEIEQQYHELKRGVDGETKAPSPAELKSEVRQIIDEMDDRGRWVSTYRGERLVGQPKFPLDSHYISSDIFSRNITTLSEYLANRRRSVHE
jgi:PelA/Pel-15E family pectate lyase